jgi:hypothetical protein
MAAIDAFCVGLDAQIRARLSLLFENDTKGRAGFVKMAGFRQMDWPNSLLIRCYEVRYSGTFLSVFTKFEYL